MFSHVFTANDALFTPYLLHYFLYLLTLNISDYLLQYEEDDDEDDGGGGGTGATGLRFTDVSTRGKSTASATDGGGGSGK